MRETDCANTEGIFRIVQSIPSPKAEPFKRWLAKVGYERVLEIENPELAQERMKKLYEQKGYSAGWIDKRLRGIAIRQNLTDEWKERGMSAERDFAILTAEISKATFGMTLAQYKEHKNLKKENLRDHMTDLELIFTPSTFIPRQFTAGNECAGKGGRGKRCFPRGGEQRSVENREVLKINSSSPNTPSAKSEYGIRRNLLCLVKG